MPSLKQLAPVEDWCARPAYSDVCAEFPFMIALVQNFTNSTSSQFRHSLQAAYDLLPNSGDPLDMSKPKRSLLPFIGKLSSSLFGTATEEDVEIVAAHVQSLSKSQSQLLAGFQLQNEHMSSFMTLTQARMSNLDAMLRQQSTTFSDAFLAERRRSAKHDTALNLMLYTLFSKFADSSLLHHQVNDLYNGLQMLLAGFLPSSLIPSGVLKQTTKAIGNHLYNSFGQLQLAETDPSYYYSSHDFLFYRRRSNLFITVKFPLSVRHIGYLNVFKATVFPVPFHNNSDLLTLVQTPAQYLLVSYAFDYFAELPPSATVPKQVSVDILSRISRPSCLFSLFQDAPSVIQADCKFQVLKSSDITTELYVLNYPQILLRSPHYLSVTCPYPYTSPPPCSYCFYSVPCACSVQTIQVFLPPRVSHCNTSDSLPLASPLQYPVNLALLHHFFDNDTLAIFASDTLLSSPLSVELPPMKFFNHSFDEKLATSTSLSYQLDKVVNATKADENIYRSIVDPLLFGDLYVPSNFFFTPPGYLALATTGLASFNLVFTFWLAYRLRLVSAALLGVANHASIAHAHSLPPILVATLSPSSTPSTILNFPSSYSSDYFGYLLLILFVIFIVTKFRRCFVRRFESSPDFDLCLEIKAKRRCFFVTLQTVSGCPTDFVVAGTTLSSQIAVVGWFRPKLCITWGDLTISHKTTGRPLLLSPHFSISFLERFKLSSVFTNPYECYLFFSHAGRGNYVTLTTASSGRVGGQAVLLPSEDC